LGAGAENWGAPWCIATLGERIVTDIPHTGSLGSVMIVESLPMFELMHFPAFVSRVVAAAMLLALFALSFPIYGAHSGNEPK
jgi:hypothetical protein